MKNKYLHKEIIGTTLCASFLLNIIIETPMEIKANDQLKVIPNHTTLPSVAVLPKTNPIDQLVKISAVEPIESNITRLKQLNNRLYLDHQHDIHLADVPQVKPRATSTVDNNFSGTFKGIPYVCENGVLTIKANGETLDDPSNYTFNLAKDIGSDKANTVTKIVLAGPLHLTGKASYFFSGFSNITTIDNLKQLDTSKVTDMSNMFDYCSSLTNLDVSKFDTSKVTDMSNMFDYCSSLTNLDISKFDTSKVTDMQGIFYYCKKLTNLNLNNFDTSNVTDMNFMFCGCESFTDLNVNNFDTSKVTNFYAMFDRCLNLTSLDVSKFDTSNAINMNSMFSSCSSLTSLDVSKFDTSKVTTMRQMFFNCSSLTNLYISHFDTSKVIDMDSMFWNCSNLTNLDVSKFDTSNVVTMYDMFSYCSRLTNLDVSKFDTSNVINMDSMFNSCSSLTSLDVSNFDTSNVTHMGFMFEGCSSLTSLDVSKFNTSKVTNMCQMFYNCSNLTSLDVSHFDTSKVIDSYISGISSMFEGCSNLTSLDISSFDMSNVTDTNSMFDNCSSLTSLKLGPKNKFNSNANLPACNDNEYWINQSTSTTVAPKGDKRLTSSKLLTDYNGAKDADTYIRTKTYPVVIDYYNSNSPDKLSTDTINMPNIAAGFLPGQQIDYQQTFADKLANFKTKGLIYNPKKSNIPFLDYPNANYKFTLPANYSGQSYKAVFDQAIPITIKYIDLDDNNKILQTNEIKALNGETAKIDLKTSLIKFGDLGYTHDQVNDQIPKNIAINHIDKDNNKQSGFSDQADVNEITLPETGANAITLQFGLKHRKTSLKTGDKIPDTDKLVDLTHTVKRTIKYQGLSKEKAIPDTIQSVDFTRTCQYDHVLKQPIYSKWDTDNKPFEQVSIPKVKGYKTSNDFVNAETVGPDSKDLTQTVTYTPNRDTKITIDYVDGSNHDNILATDTVSALAGDSVKYDANSKIVNLEKQGLILDKQNSNYPFPSDNELTIPEDAKDDLHYQIKLRHKQIKFTPDDEGKPVPDSSDKVTGLTKKVNWIIKYQNSPDSSKTPDNTQSYTFKRSGTYDYYLKKMIYDNWNVKDYQFGTIVTPKFAGYTPDKLSLTGIKVTPDSEDKTDTVTYRQNQAIKVNIDFYDTTSNKIIKTKTLNSFAGMDVTFDPKDDLQGLENQGYQLDKTEWPKENKVTIPETSKEDLHYQIQLSHKQVKFTPDDEGKSIPDSSDKVTGLTKKVNWTIKYQGLPDDKKITDNSQSYTFKRSGTYDYVAKKMIYEPWNEPSKQLDDVNSPKVKGYTPDQAIIKGLLITPEMDAKDTIVTYHKNKDINFVIHIKDTDDDHKEIATIKLPVTVGTDLVYNLKDKIAALENQGYEVDDSKWPKDNTISIPDDTKDDQEITLNAKHKTKTLQPDDLDPGTGTKAVGLKQTITQVIHYKGTKDPILDHSQSVVFTRSGTYDYVTKKIKFDNWDHSELPFKDVVSPIVKGYTADKLVIKDQIAKPTDNGLDKTLDQTVTYQQNKTVKINMIFQDETGKTIDQDAISGIAGTSVSYNPHDKITQLENQGYEVDVSNWPKDNQIDLPVDSPDQKDIIFKLKHKIKTLQPGDKIPDTDKVADLTRKVTQTIHYTGAVNVPKDDVQEINFKRTGQYDYVTKEMLYNAWDKASDQFKNVSSPKIDDYEPDQAIIKGQVVTPTNPENHELKYTVTYHSTKVEKDHQVNICYQDENGTNIKKVTLTGKAGTKVKYDAKTDITNLTKQGYEINQTDVPADDITIPVDQETTDIVIKMKHRTAILVANEKNPVTQQIEPSLTKKVTRTIKYRGANEPIKTVVQAITFQRSATIDLVTGQIIKYHDWNQSTAQFESVDSPAIKDYLASQTTIAAVEITPDSNNIVEEVTYVKQDSKISKVTIHYQDKNGQLLLNQTILYNKIGVTYTIDRPIIKGYSLYKIIGDPNGKFSTNDQDVYLVYQKLTSPDIVPDDPDSNKLINHDNHDIVPDNPVDHISNLPIKNENKHNLPIMYLPNDKLTKNKSIAKIANNRRVIPKVNKDTVDSVANTPIRVKSKQNESHTKQKHGFLPQTGHKTLIGTLVSGIILLGIGIMAYFKKKK